MGKYRIKSPDGRTITVSGNKPPTQEEAAEIFSKLPPVKQEPVKLQGEVMGENIGEAIAGEIGADIGAEVGKNVEDVARSAISGLTMPFRGAGELGEKIGGFLGEGLRSAMGKEPLTPEQLEELPSSSVQQFLQSLKHEPQTGLGELASFGGELIPTLALPGGTIAKGANFLPQVAKVAGLGGISGATIDALQTAEQGGSLGDIGERTASGAGLGAAISGATPILGKVGQKSFDALQPKIAEFAAQIPEQSFKKALQQERAGQSIFNQPYSEDVFSELSEKLQGGFRAAKSDTEEAIGQATQGLPVNQTVKLEDIMGKISNILESSVTPGAKRGAAFEASEPALRRIIEDFAIFPKAGEEINLDKLTPSLENISNLIKNEEIAGDIPIGSLNEFKKALQQEITNWAEGAGKADKKLIKKVQNVVNKKLKEEAPELGMSNETYSELMDIKKEVDKLTPSKLSQLGTNTNKINKLSDKIKKIESKLPENSRISEELELELARKAFASKNPNLAPFFTGRAIAAAGIGGGATALLAPQLLLPASLAGLAETVPAVQAGLIRGQVGAGKKIQPILEQQLAKILLTADNPRE